MVTLAQAKERIKTKWDWSDTNNNYPVILWGAPGVGKTQIIYQLIAERLIEELELEFYEYTKEIKEKNNLKREDLKSNEEWKKKEKELKNKREILNSADLSNKFMELIEPHCLVIRLAERPIEQLQGVVIPSLSDNFARFVMPENLVKIKESKWGIVFLDELDKASDSKFGAATHILENKIVGDLQLGEGWYVIAAANREEDTHLANPVPPELRNRCAHLEIEPDLENWVQWAVSHNVRQDIILFHKWNNGAWLSNYELEQTYAYPTPRSWVMASRTIDRLENKLQIDKNNTKQVEHFNDLIRNELEDFVGKQAQNEFFIYRDLYLKYDIMKILEGEERIPNKDTISDEVLLINEQCVAAFAMADRLDSDIFIVEKANESNGYKFKYNETYVKNIIQFISDLIPEVRTIYLRQIYATRIINIITDSGLADQELDDLAKFIAAG